VPDKGFTFILPGLPHEAVVFTSEIADTNSLDPLLDTGHTGILVKLPQTPAPYRYEDLKVGDLAVYQIATKLIIHRIIQTGTDADGRWYIFRGDNTAHQDPYVLRDKHIKYLVIGVIY